MEVGALGLRLKRLRWLARRGMKELDVLIEGFIRQESRQLSDGAWPELEAFLGSEDDRLWDWLQGRDAPENPAWAEIVAAIRACAGRAASTEGQNGSG